jgi:hypothetical protein
MSSNLSLFHVFAISCVQIPCFEWLVYLEKLIISQLFFRIFSFLEAQLHYHVQIIHTAGHCSECFLFRSGLSSVICSHIISAPPSHKTQIFLPTRRMLSSGMLRREALVITDVSEDPSASIFRVTRISELRTKLAVTSNGRTLRRHTRGHSSVKCSI